MSAPAASWCDPAGGSPAQVRGSARLVVSVAWPLATVDAKRTQRLPRGATAGDDRKMNNEPLEREPMNNEPLEREPIDGVRARLEALLKANAAPRCGARSKRTGKPCRGAAMPNGRCKLHGGKSTGPRTPEGLERSKRARLKHGYDSREAKVERSRVRAAILAVRHLRMLGH